MFKLVRDKIPELIQENGDVFDYAVIQNDEFFRAMLKNKLIEEVNEYLGSNDSLEELADIQLVLNTLVGDQKEEFDRIYAVKRAERGEFSKRYLGFFADPAPEVLEN